MTTDPAAPCTCSSYFGSCEYSSDCERHNPSAPVPAAPVSDVEAHDYELSELLRLHEIIDGASAYQHKGLITTKTLAAAEKVLAEGYVSPTQAAKDRAEAQAAGWEEALQAVAWCLRNGASSIEEILAYVGGNNPYRADRISGE